MKIEDEKKIFIEKETKSAGIYCILCKDSGSIEVYIIIIIINIIDIYNTKS